MSSNASGSEGDDGPTVGREVAYRLFAAAYDDASLSHAESDEERAPNYVITPTGARVNRLFAVGTLTEVTPVNEEMVRARVVDPTGAFVVYAGQYQPEALAFLERAEPPLFVAVTGKARTFEPDDGDRVYTSIRPESIATVDADTRDRWVVETARQTLDRIATYAAAAGIDASGEALEAALREAGVDAATAAGVPLAQGHYGTTPAYLQALRTLSLDAVRVVAGERDQVQPLALAPGDAGADAATFADLASTVAVDVDAASAAASEADEAPAVASSTESASEPAESSAASSDESLDESAPSAAESAEEPAESGTASADTAATADSSATDDEAPGSDDAADAIGDTPGTDDEGEATDDATSSETAAGNGDLDVDVTEADVGMYEMDDEERAELEEKFGAEFTTGAEVDEHDESDDDASEPTAASTADAAAESVVEGDAASDEHDASSDDDDLGDFQPTGGGLGAVDEGEADDDDLGEAAEEGDDVEAESVDDEEAAADDERADDEADAPDDGEDAEDVDLQAAVVDAMADLDAGEGADRSAVIETVVEETGAGEATVEAAIEDALMGGQCYEPDDETLKAI